jgi:hypothetical protein
MLGNGMMGAGVVAGPVVFFGLFVWVSLFAVSVLACFWMMRTLRGFKEKYNALREPSVLREPIVAYGSGGVLNVDVAIERIRDKESKKKERAA